MKKKCPGPVAQGIVSLKSLVEDLLSLTALTKSVAVIYFFAEKL